MSRDRTSHLRHWMQQVGFSSFRALRQASGVSEAQLRHLRQGTLSQLRVETLVSLSKTLEIAIADLLAILLEPVSQATDLDDQPPDCDDPAARFDDQTPDSDDLARRFDDLKQEYERLQAQLAQQKQDLWQEFQQSSLQILESLLLQLPTAAYAAQQNPQVSATKLLPLLKPLDRLLQTWEIAAIAPVGAEVPYDPRWHQLMDGSADAGALVKVRYTGYIQADRLLYRAKVSPVDSGTPS